MWLTGADKTSKIGEVLIAMCDFDSRCVFEEPIGAPLWELCTERGRELDLDKGGYCDAKNSVIQFWCGPEDRPPSWRGEPIRKRALRHPRSLVGAVYAEFGKETVTLHWLLYPYDKAAYLEGIESSFDLRHPVERYGTEDDLEWCRGKFRELLAWAREEYERRVPRYSGKVWETELHCPSNPDHRVVALEPPFQTWEYYCLDCGALTCVVEKLPPPAPGAIGQILQVSYPRERIV